MRFVSVPNEQGLVRCAKQAGRKHTRMKSEHRISTGNSQNPSNIQCAPLYPSCRLAKMMHIVVIEDSSVHDAVLSPRKKLRLSETAIHGRVMCHGTKASSSAGGTECDAIPGEQDVNSCGTTCRLPSQNRNRQRLLHDAIVEPPWKSRSSRTEQRDLEYLATSLQTLAKDDWGCHCSSRRGGAKPPSGQGQDGSGAAARRFFTGGAVCGSEVPRGGLRLKVLLAFLLSLLARIRSL